MLLIVGFVRDKEARQLMLPGWFAICAGGLCLYMWCFERREGEQKQQNDGDNVVGIRSRDERLSDDSTPLP